MSPASRAARCWTGTWPNTSATTCPVGPRCPIHATAASFTCPPPPARGDWAPRPPPRAAGQGRDARRPQTRTPRRDRAAGATTSMPVPASARLLPQAWRSWCARTGVASPARREAAASSCPTASGAHRRPERLTEGVDEHEIAAAGPGDPHPLELIGVTRLHHQEIKRHDPLPPRFRPRLVLVVPPPLPSRCG